MDSPEVHASFLQHDSKDLDEKKTDIKESKNDEKTDIKESENDEKTDIKENKNEEKSDTKERKSEKETDTKEKKMPQLIIDTTSDSLTFEDGKCFSKQMFNYLSKQQLMVHGEEDMPSEVASEKVDFEDNDKCLIKSPTFELCWAVFIAFLLILTIIIVPFEASFVQSAPGNVVFVIEILIDVGFAADIVLTFMTPYTDTGTGKLIKNHKQIAYHYLTRWFIFDLLTIFPVTVLKAFRFFRLFRIFRFVKFVKMIRVYRYKKKFYEDFPILSMNSRREASYFRLVRIWFLLLTFGHVLACAWWYIGSVGGEENNWVASYEKFRGRNLVGWEDQYLASLNWALSTLTTVGYGDVHATNAAEMNISSLSMLFSITFLAHMTGAVESLLSSYEKSDQNDTVILEKMMAVAQFSRDVKLPTEIRRVLFKHGRGNLKIRPVVEMNELLPTEQERRQIYPFVYKELFLACPFLTHLHKRITHDGCWNVFVANFCPHISAQLFAPKQYIFEKGSIVNMIFFIAEGEIITSTEIKYKKGDCVGVTPLCSFGIWPFDIQTTKQTKIFCLEKKHFINFLEKMETAICSHNVCLSSIPTLVRQWTEAERERNGLKGQNVVQWKSVEGFRSALQQVSHKKINASSSLIVLHN